MRKLIPVHITQVKPGDTIFHDGHDRTVCRTNIKHDPFMGLSVFGDTYNMGYKKVIKVIFETGNYYIRNKESGLYFSGWTDEGAPIFGDASESKPYASKQAAECQIQFLRNCEIE